MDIGSGGQFTAESRSGWPVSHCPVNGQRVSVARDRSAACMARAWPTLRWPDFGRTTLQNNARRRQPVRTILAGQPSTAQVADPRGTVYGSEGSSSLPSSLDSSNVRSYAGAPRQEPAARCWGRDAGILPLQPHGQQPHDVLVRMWDGSPHCQTATGPWCATRCG